MKTDSNRTVEIGWRLLACAGAVTGILTAASTAWAQDQPKVDLALGSLSVNGTMFGTNVQAAAPLGQRWSLVGEVDWSRGHDPDDDGTHYADIAALGGVRYGWRPDARVLPFVQVMGGRLESRATTTGCYMFSAGCYRDSFTIDYLVVQPGGGATIMITPRFGVRAQADMQFAMARGYEGMSIFPRVVVGGVIALGTRR